MFSILLGNGMHKHMPALENVHSVFHKSQKLPRLKVPKKKSKE